MRRYSLYMFDFDGTLFDSGRGERTCYAAAMAKVGMAPSAGEGFSGFPSREEFRVMGGGRDYEDLVRAFTEEARARMDTLTVPYPDAAPAILRISDLGMPLCIATRKSEARARTILRAYDLERYFDKVVGYESVTRLKPDPECLLICMGGYDIPRRDCVYIGDSPSDMEAAAAAGIDGVMVDREWNRGVPGKSRISGLRELV
jgi:HAD superfamily hydrolase (TIGR01549 family)